ncbi:hypothetical protein J6590_077146, partial [Homalodisca vitripennis]
MISLLINSYFCEGKATKLMGILASNGVYKPSSLLLQLPLLLLLCYVYNLRSPS